MNMPHYSTHSFHLYNLLYTTLTSTKSSLTNQTCPTPLSIPHPTHHIHPDSLYKPPYQHNGMLPSKMDSMYIVSLYQENYTISHPHLTLHYYLPHLLIVHQCPHTRTIRTRTIWPHQTQHLTQHHPLTSSLQWLFMVVPHNS
jgi:hypothetical protein